MDSDDVIPGEHSTILCLQCGSSIPFTMIGGPHHLVCQICQATVSLEVVHDGIRWTLRRIRRAASHPSI
jgi:hypothetical protein